MPWPRVLSSVTRKYITGISCLIYGDTENEYGFSVINYRDTTTQVKNNTVSSLTVNSLVPICVSLRKCQDK